LFSDAKLERSARLRFECHTHSKVVNITEPNKCNYEITLASNYACGEKYIYPHLDREHRDQWDLIETNHFYGELTQLGYQSSLHELFVETGILLNTTDSIDSNQFCFENNEKCVKKVALLQKENTDLLNRIQVLENELNKK